MTKTEKQIAKLESRIKELQEYQKTPEGYVQEEFEKTSNKIWRLFYKLRRFSLPIKDRDMIGVRVEFTATYEEAIQIVAESLSPDGLYDGREMKPSDVKQSLKNFYGLLGQHGLDGNYPQTQFFEEAEYLVIASGLFYEHQKSRL